MFLGEAAAPLAQLQTGSVRRGGYLPFSKLFQTGIYPIGIYPKP